MDITRNSPILKRNKINNDYNENAGSYAKNYNIDRKKVHEELIPYLLEMPKRALILDPAAGSLADANMLLNDDIFSEKDFRVVACEPAECLKKEGLTLYPGLDENERISILSREIPRLDGIDDNRFNLVLASAVWQELHPDDRFKAFECLSSKLIIGGLLYVTLKMGREIEMKPRGQYPVSFEELKNLAGELGLTIIPTKEPRQDTFGRNIGWKTFLARKN